MAKKKGKKKQVTRASEAPSAEANDETPVEYAPVHTTPASRPKITTELADSTSQNYPDFTAFDHNPSLKDTIAWDGSRKGQNDGAGKANDGVNHIDFASADSSAQVSPGTNKIYGQEVLDRQFGRPLPTSGHLPPGAFDRSRRSTESWENDTAISDTESSKKLGKGSQQLGSGSASGGQSPAGRGRTKSHKSLPELLTYGPSFAHPTETSMAKIQDKYPLGPRGPSKGALKDLPGSLTQGPESALGSRGRRPEIRSRRSKNSVGGSATSSRGASPRSGYLSPAKYAESGHDENDTLHDRAGEPEGQGLSGTSLSSATYQEGDENLNHESLESELVGRDYESSDFESLQASEDDGSRDAPGHPSPRSESDHTDCERRLRAAEESCAEAREDKLVLERKLQEMQAAYNMAATQLKFQELSSSSKEEEVTTHPASTVDADETLHDQIRALKEELERKNEDLKDAHAQLAKTEDEPEGHGMDARRLRREVDGLAHALRQGCPSESGKLPDTAALVVLARDYEGSFETKALCLALVRITKRFDDKVRAFQERNEELANSLSDEEDKLAIMKRTREETATAPGSHLASECERDAFQELYEKEWKQRRAAEGRATEFKRKAVEYFKPEVERDLRELKVDLTKVEDLNNVLNEKLKGQKAFAQAWKEERDTALDQLNKHTAEAQQEYQAQMQVLLHHIAEYRRKIKEVDLRDITGLQSKIESLERSLEDAERSVQTFNNENVNLRQDIEKLSSALYDCERRNEWQGNFDSDPGSDDSSHASSPEEKTRPRRHVPRVLQPHKIAEREVCMRELRDDQLQSRRKRRGEEELLERVIAFRMKELYPPRRNGWEALKVKDRWDRWDGKGWVAEKQATPADLVMIEAMKKDGLWGMSNSVEGREARDVVPVPPRPMP